MVVMAVTTVVAAAAVAPRIDAGTTPWMTSLPELTDAAWILFAVALVGWMPAPVDISVWHSMWTLEKARQTGRAATRRQCEADFLVGYALCVVLAGAFVVLGAGLMYQSGTRPAGSAGAFAGQLVGLYTQALGEWARPLIGGCAVAVMFSTMLTVVDALPRSAAAIVTPERAGAQGAAVTRESARRGAYWAWALVIAAGAMGIITIFRARMPELVSLATSLSFLGTPVLCWFNHRAMTGPRVPAEHRPGAAMRAWSWAGIAVWSGFAGVYLWTLTRGVP
jgi:Mn2+/Fe2+ NRAMP family transporter